MDADEGARRDRTRTRGAWNVCSNVCNNISKRAPRFLLFDDDQHTQLHIISIRFWSSFFELPECWILLAASATDATPTVRIGFIRPLMPFQRSSVIHHHTKVIWSQASWSPVQINVTWGRTCITSIAAGVEEPEEMTRDTMLHVYYSLETVWVLLQFEA